MSDISGKAILITLIGGVLAYSGLKGKGIASTTRALISGQDPTGVPSVQTIASGSSGTGSDLGITAQPSAATGIPAQNKAIARLLAAPYGWSAGIEWDSLDKLWTRESGWSNTALNASSGAYGIVQALPPTKLPASGQAPPVGSSSASAQIAWGLAYIKSRYGSPSAAWAHETANSWY